MQKQGTAANEMHKQGSTHKGKEINARIGCVYVKKTHKQGGGEQNAQTKFQLGTYRQTDSYTD